MATSYPEIEENLVKCMKIAPCQSDVFLSGTRSLNRGAR